MKYYMGDADFKWADLVPGDSIVVPRRIPFESATTDMEIRHGDERVLIVALSKIPTHIGLTTLRVWMLGKSGLVYINRNLGGDPAKPNRQRW